MAIFVNAIARKFTTSTGYWVDVRVQYTNNTEEFVLIRPNQAVFELLDSADQPVQRRSPEIVPDVVPPGECFRFEFSFTTEANLQRSKHSLRSAIGDESAYSLIQLRSAAELTPA